MSKLQVPHRVFCSCLIVQDSQSPASSLAAPPMGMHVQQALQQLDESWYSSLYMPNGIRKGLRPPGAWKNCSSFSECMMAWAA